MLTAEPPGFSPAEAERLASRHFGIEASAKRLWSERDQNFRLTSDDGRKFVLKIANTGEDPEVLDFQQKALAHIAQKDPALPVPRILPCLDGSHYALARDGEGREHMIRTVSWLEGEEIEETVASDDLLGEMGATLARLGLALQDFDHPASRHELLWDLKHAAELSRLLGVIKDVPLRSLVDTALQRFNEHVVPVLPTLRNQVIHADLNRGNVLVCSDEPRRVTGIIDFGDMVYTPLIMDLAIAAAYHLNDSGDPLARSLRLIGSYHQVLPVRLREASILVDLMLGRLCTSITLQLWRASLYPDNSEYLLVHQEHIRNRLRHVLSYPREQLQGTVLAALGFESQS